MRRVILSLLRCPACRHGGLSPEGDAAEVVFGPVRCPECHSTYPVSEGAVDLLPGRVPEGLNPIQRGLEQPLVARSYERYVRPALQFAIAGRRYDRDSEFLLYRSLLGQLDAPVLDVACGTGLFARRLARDPSMPPVVGMDASRPMIEEGIAQAREAGVLIDFVRAHAPELPFLDQSVGGVLQTGAVHLIEDLGRLLLEVGRVLRPGGRYVASTYLPRGPLLSRLDRKAGLHLRTEDELRTATAAAGLVSFERVLVPPFIVIRAEKPSGR